MLAHIHTTAREVLRVSSRLLSFTAAFAALVSLAQALEISPNARVKGAENPGADNIESFELVDPKVLRVCADPNNLPFSNEKGEGFENKIAAFLAGKLHKELAYTYYPGASGFVRNTLNAHLCDVILGMPQGNDLVQTTNPYYRTTYAVVTRKGSELEGMKSLADPRLKASPHRIGLVANTPPGNVLANLGLLGSMKPYPLMIDTRFDSSSAAMIGDLQKGETDLALMWGPIAGYYVSKSEGKLTRALLSDEPGARMAFRICFGVRHSDQNWKRELNQLIQQNKPEIEKILLGYGLPMLDDDGHEIAAKP